MSNPNTFQGDTTIENDLAADNVSTPIFTETTASVVRAANASYSASDFVFGSPMLADSGTAVEDNRFLFDKSAYAFRAGRATDASWDSRGNGSAAFGSNCVASGATSFAAGNSSDATGASAVAIGDSNVVAGDKAVALGGSCGKHNAGS